MENYRTIRNVRGNVFYFNAKGQAHRLDGPAVIWANGDKVWCIHGRCHRLNGPAVEYSKGDKAWYLINKIYPKMDHNIFVLFSALEPKRIDLNPVQG